MSNVGILILSRHGSPLRTVWIYGPEDESFPRGLRRHEACSPEGRLMVSLSMRGRDIWSGPTPEEPWPEELPLRSSAALLYTVMPCGGASPAEKLALACLADAGLRNSSCV